MAKLSKLPTKSVIKGLAGLLDFYVINGQPLVRRWPNKSHSQPTTIELCNQTRFAHWQEGSKCYHQWLRDLDKHACTLSSWRWNDYAFKRYMGDVPYAPRQLERPAVPTSPPCPTDPFQLWQVHALYIDLKRRTDIDLDPPHGLWQKRYWVDIIAWTDLAGMDLEWIWSYWNPYMRRHHKMERGEKVFCAWEPLEMRHEQVGYGGSCFYGEWPWVTHNFTLSPHLPLNIDDVFFCHLRASHHDYPWWANPHAYSVGPMFGFVWPGYPAMEVHEHRFHYLEPLFPTRLKGPFQPTWVDHLDINRSVHWPTIDIDDDYFQLTVRQGIP